MARQPTEEEIKAELDNVRREVNDLYNRLNQRLKVRYRLEQALAEVEEG